MVMVFIGYAILAAISYVVIGVLAAMATPGSQDHASPGLTIVHLMLNIAQFVVPGLFVLCALGVF